VQRPVKKVKEFGIMKGLKHLALSQKFVTKPMMMLAAITAIAILSVSILSVSTKAVSIQDGKEVQTVYTLSSEPDAILDAAGVELGSKDEYTFSGMEGTNGKITLLRAFPVTVDAYGKTYKVETTGGTVADALKAAGIELSEEDILNFSKEDTLKSGMAIAVTDVEFKTEAKEISIPYSTKVVYDDNLEEGKTSLKEGTQGVKVITYTYKFVDGQLVDTQVASETVAKAPVDAVKTVGTKKKPTNTYKNSQTKYVSGLVPAQDFELDENGIPVKYTKKISGKASAYSGGGVTATGKSVRTGYVAVNPNVIPYGTRLFIRCQNGSYIYGYAVAEDTGGFTKSTDRVVDLYFPTQSQCKTFGVRYVDIYVLG